jgi:hypothetical protein
MQATPIEAIDLFIWSRSSGGPIRAGQIGLSIYPIARIQVSRCVSGADGILPELTGLCFWAKSLAGIELPSVG